jgi:ubiquinone biosynthesis monooxygenase Coq7
MKYRQDAGPACAAHRPDGPGAATPMPSALHNSGMLTPLTPKRRDELLNALDVALRTLSGGHRARRPAPTAAPPVEATALSAPQRQLSGALMRVNHVGEVCAQALYNAQALAARDPALKAHLLHAGEEECDHLAWTADRLKALGDRPSLLNPLWYAGAFAIGSLAARLGDGISLGFVQETEQQVEAHLASHLSRLPEQDLESRAIVRQMKEDEAEHAAWAAQAGATDLPQAVKWAMQAAARVMTATAHRI